VGLGAFAVGVHPLVVVGDVGELVDAVLVDRCPSADAELLTDHGDSIVDRGDFLHVRA
jgi:hypothetical protein